MILAHDVSRSAEGQHAGKKRVAGPFAGMNQREARIPLRTSRVRTSKPVSTTGRSHRNQTASANSADPNESSEKATRTKDKSKDERPLFHALKMQSTLTPIPYYQRDKLKEQIEKINSFEELSLSQPIIEAIHSGALPSLTTYTPTPIQKLAIPILLSKKGQFEKRNKKKSSVEGSDFDKFLIAAETGSGKTLAYLLPVIQAMKEQEELEKSRAYEIEKSEKSEPKKDVDPTSLSKDDLAELSNDSDSDVGRPKVLVLLPSSELVTQVGKVVKSMSHFVKYRSAPISASSSPTVIRNRLFNLNGIDVVISTPHLISSIAETEPNILSRVQHLIIDEADSMFDRSFLPTTSSIIDRAAPSLKQLILCSATIPTSLDKFMDKHYPEIKRVVTPKLHTVTRRVQLGVVDIEKLPYRGNRALACADVIWQIGKHVHEDTKTHHLIKSILVFVNERKEAEEVAKVLASKGIEAVALTRDTSEQRQAEILHTFTSSTPVEGELKAPKASKSRFGDFVPFDSFASGDHTTEKWSKRLPNTRVLVTTDLGSRGIDTLAVRTVVLYDVPHTTIDFLHRLGRVGRMNRRGRGIVLVGKHDRKDIVREVQDAMFRGQALI